MNEREMQDYIMHYGVLGMKWGQRKVRQHSEKARNMNKSAKYRAKHAAKAKKIENKHRLYGGNAAYNRVKKTSLGKAVLQSLVFGTYGALKYNSARAKDNSRAESAINATLYYVGNNLTSGLMSVVEPRLDKNKKK